VPSKDLKQNQQQTLATAMCGPRKNRCTEFDACEYQAQIGQLLEQRTNLVMLTHASFWGMPLGGDRLPVPLPLAHWANPPSTKPT
jgi:hypothetical protein